MAPAARGAAPAKRSRDLPLQPSAAGRPSRSLVPRSRQQPPAWSGRPHGRAHPLWPSSSPGSPPRDAPLLVLTKQVGRLITFNTIKTKQGWIWAGGVLAVFALIQMYYIGSAILQKRRHLRALEDVKKL